MKELWRKTFGMLREHRVLWAPYAVAELLAFSLLGLCRFAIRAMLLWLSTTTTRSVLGGMTESYNAERGQYKAILLGGLLENGTHYLNVCLLTLALALTTVLILAFLRGETPDRPRVVAALRPYSKSILVFGLKFCVVAWIATIVICWPLAYLQNEFLRPSRTALPLVLDGEGLLLMVCVAWIMTPVAIVLLRPPSAPLVDAEQKSMARHLSLLTVLAMSVLQFLDHRIDVHLRFSSRSEVTIVSALAALVINAPMALLFTAFALIATDQVPETESRSGFHLPQTIKDLMPLHFRPDQEPDQNPGPATEP